MARKLRLEYEGARYHVINRGNYRGDIFGQIKARKAFEQCVFEACAKAKWSLHGYVIMRNHYHLALETPEGNLVEGMRWLQSTFANRFNRFRGERGHVFQGRYQAILVENGAAMAAVTHYVHLNPVRARVVPIERLGEYRCSSYPHYLAEPKQRPSCLEVELTLGAAGELKDTARGRAKYGEYLAWLAEDAPAQKQLRFQEMSQGWALGSNEFKAALVAEHKVKLGQHKDGSESEIRELRELQWRELLERCLRRLKKTEQDCKAERKSADWKVAVAAHLKATTLVKNPWLAEALKMGDPDGVSRYVSELRTGKRSKAKSLLTHIADIRV